MEVMKDRRMVFEKSLHLVARQSQRHSQTIAVVIVRYILAPENQARRIFAGVRFSVVVGIDHHVAAINFQNRRDQNDYILADGLNEWTLFNCQPVSQLH